MIPTDKAKSGKHYASLETPARDKHASLLGFLVIYEISFTTFPWHECMVPFFVPDEEAK